MDIPRIGVCILRAFHVRALADRKGPAVGFGKVEKRISSWLDNKVDLTL